MSGRAWVAEARCRSHAEVDFFDPDQAMAAKAICAACPVIEPCRSYALTHHEVGVWGGQDDDDRSATKRRRRLLEGSSSAGSDGDARVVVIRDWTDALVDSTLKRQRSDAERVVLHRALERLRKSANRAG